MKKRLSMGKRKKKKMVKCGVLRLSGLRGYDDNRQCYCKPQEERTEKWLPQEERKEKWLSIGYTKKKGDVEILKL
jgi:hypothetical protein